MKVAELMSRDVEFIDKNDTIQAAAVLMGEIDVGALPVGSAANPVGVITSRDVLYRICSAGRDPSTTLVGEAMTEHVYTCHPDEDVEAALDLMAGFHVRRLLVRESDGRTVGWLTLGDISRKLLIDSGTIRDGLADLGRYNQRDISDGNHSRG
jgi:CBS domain-containing protein